MRINWLIVGVLSLWLFYGCGSSVKNTLQDDTTSENLKSVQKIQKYSLPKFDKCDGLQSQVDSSYYLIQLSEKAMTNLKSLKPYTITNQTSFNQEAQGLVRKYLGDSITGINRKRDSVIYTCPCGLILMGTDNPLDPVERGREQASKVGSTSDTMFTAIDYNYNFFVKPLGRLDNEKSFEDNGVPPNKTVPSLFNRIRIAIVDSGINSSHDSLKRNIWYNPTDTRERGQRQLDNDQNGIVNDLNGFNFLNLDDDLSDYTGHGTHVAGIINGSYQNDYFNEPGFNESIELMNLKIIGKEKDSTSLFSAICAMQYAIDNKADIINASWGFYAKDTSTILAQVIEKARDSSVLIVAGAGNDAVDIDKCQFWPASFSTMYENVIAVAAAEKNKENNVLADWSNYGEKSVNLAAQGTRIKSTFPKDAIKKISGTSMAAPAVSRYIAWLRFNEIEKKLEKAARERIFEKVEGDKIPSDGPIGSIPIDKMKGPDLVIQNQSKPSKPQMYRVIYKQLRDSLQNISNDGENLKQITIPRHSNKRLKNNVVLKSKN